MNKQTAEIHIIVDEREKTGEQERAGAMIKISGDVNMLVNAIAAGLLSDPKLRAIIISAIQLSLEDGEDIIKTTTKLEANEKFTN